VVVAQLEEPPPPPPPFPTVAPTRVPTVHSLPPSLQELADAVTAFVLEEAARDAGPRARTRLAPEQ
jgi:hypothetical protein